MAPKLKAITDLGYVTNDAGKHRACVCIARTTTKAPWRASKNQADADLAYARQASSREEMQTRIVSGVPEPVGACSDVAELAAETHNALDSKQLFDMPADTTAELVAESTLEHTTPEEQVATNS